MEAFVYKWIDKGNSKHKFYIGSHKGTLNDGYIATSDYFMEQYNLRPENFERIIFRAGICKIHAAIFWKASECAPVFNAKQSDLFLVFFKYHMLIHQ